MSGVVLNTSLPSDEAYSIYGYKVATGWLQKNEDGPNPYFSSLMLKRDETVERIGGNGNINRELNCSGT